MSPKCLPTKFDCGIQLFELNVSAKDTSQVPDWRLSTLTFKNPLVGIDGSTVVLLHLWRDTCIVTWAQCSHLLCISCSPEGKTSILLPEINVLGIDVDQLESRDELISKVGVCLTVDLDFVVCVSVCREWDCQ